MDTLKNIIKILNNKNNFGICTHYEPDGDAIGSLLGLKLALIKANKKVKAFSPTPLVEPYQPFLLEFSDVIIGLPPDNEFDVLIFVDCSNVKRLRPDGTYSPKAKIIINIDHHADNTKFGTLNLLQPASPACAQIIYELLNELDWEIDKQIAICLYVGLITDTGRFVYPSTSYRTLEIASDLLKKGVKPDILNSLVYEQESMETVHLLGETLVNLKTSKDNNIIWAVVTKEMLAKTSALEENADIIIEEMRMVKGAKVFLSFRESDNCRIKVSLRSKEGFPVDKIAHIFGGGGHPAASGCRIKASLQEAEKLVLNEIKKLL